MDENIIIQPIEENGFIVEVAEQFDGDFIVEAAPESWQGYIVNIENTAGDSILELSTTETSNPIEISPVAVSGEVLELQPISDNLIIELFVGFEGGRVTLTGHVEGQESAGNIDTTLTKLAITSQSQEVPNLADALLFYSQSGDTLLQASFDALKTLFAPDLSDYATILWVENNFADINHKHSEYLTEPDVITLILGKTGSFTGAQLTNRQIAIEHGLGYRLIHTSLFINGRRIGDANFEVFPNSNIQATLTVNTRYVATTVIEYRMS